MIDVLYRAVSAFPARIEHREPRVLLTGFGDSAVQFEVSVWTQNPWGSRADLSNLNHVIWNALRDSSISIPFPQQDVRVISVPGGKS